MKIFNKIQYIVLYIISFFIIGLTSVIAGDLKWGSFKDPIFYIQNLLTYAAIVCIIVATLLAIIDKFKQTDVEYIDTIKLITTFASTTYRPTIFSRYCEYINRKRKIKQFVYNTKKELYKLERKAKEEDLYLWNNERQAAIKDKNIYCLKRLRLESMLDIEWVEENIDKINVKYDRITSGVVLGGEFSKEDNFSVNDYITKHKQAKVARDKLPMIILSFGITCFISSIIVGFRFDASALIMFLTKTLVLCFNTFMTIRYANDYNTTVTIKDARFRKGIINEYNTWVNQQSKNNESADTEAADKLYEEAKQEAAERKPDEPKGIQKIIQNTPVGIAADIIKEVVNNDRRREDSDTTDDRGVSDGETAKQ